VESGVLGPPAHRGWYLVPAPRWGFPVQGVRFGGLKSDQFHLQIRASGMHTGHVHVSCPMGHGPWRPVGDREAPGSEAEEVGGDSPQPVF
jgi:hypothetical protein